MITIVWALILAIFMPDNPVDAKFINEREKAIAVDRMRSDQTGIENKTFKREQMFEALRDPKTWLMVLFNLWVSVPNGGLSNVSCLVAIWPLPTGLRVLIARLVQSSHHQWPWIQPSTIHIVEYTPRCCSDVVILYLQRHSILSGTKAPCTPGSRSHSHRRLGRRPHCVSVSIHSPYNQPSGPACSIVVLILLFGTLCC